VHSKLEYTIALPLHVYRTFWNTYLFWAVTRDPVCRTESKIVSKYSVAELRPSHLPRSVRNKKGIKNSYHVVIYTSLHLFSATMICTFDHLRLRSWDRFLHRDLHDRRASTWYMSVFGTTWRILCVSVLWLRVRWGYDRQFSSPPWRVSGGGGGAFTMTQSWICAFKMTSAQALSTTAEIFIIMLQGWFFPLIMDICNWDSCDSAMRHFRTSWLKLFNSDWYPPTMPLRKKTYFRISELALHPFIRITYIYSSYRSLFKSDYNFKWTHRNAISIPLFMKYCGENEQWIFPYQMCCQNRGIHVESRILRTVFVRRMSSI